MVQAYIVDTSILIQGFIDDNHTSHVLSLLNEMASENGVSIYIPEFCLVECANILWKRVRYAGVQESIVAESLLEIVAVPLTIVEASPLLPRALTIGIAHRLAIYDSVYLALCEALNAPLITADARQDAVARQLGIRIKPITDFPAIPPE